jgi:hypothetical protein
VKEMEKYWDFVTEIQKERRKDFETAKRKD